MGLRTFLGLKRPHAERAGGAAPRRMPLRRPAKIKPPLVNGPTMQFAELHWEGENDRLVVGDEAFNLSVVDFRSKTTDDAIVLLKSKRIIDDYQGLLSGRPIRSMLEFGTWEGGSPIFFAAATSIQRIVGIDLKDPSEDVLRRAAPYADRLKLYYNTSQSDAEAVNKILDDNFDGPLDLVIDDASHLYEHTKAAFEIAFPRLRDGGLYVIEDWAWAHFERDIYDLKWKDQPALANLALEIVMAVGSYSAIASIDVRPWGLIIAKGSQPPFPFKLDDLIRLRPHRKFKKI